MSSQQRYKYPRTPHLSLSPGVGGDDLKLDSARIFSDRQNNKRFQTENLQ